MKITGLNSNAVQPSYGLPGGSAGSSSVAALPTDAPKAAQQSSAQFVQVVEDMQSKTTNAHVSMSFSTYGAKKERIAVVVKNDTTGQVVREIPTKEAQALYSKISQMIDAFEDRLNEKA